MRFVLSFLAGYFTTGMTVIRVQQIMDGLIYIPVFA